MFASKDARSIKGGYRLPGSGFRVECCRCRVQVLGHQVQDLNRKVWDVGSEFGINAKRGAVLISFWGPRGDHCFKLFGADGSKKRLLRFRVRGALWWVWVVG